MLARHDQSDARSLAPTREAMLTITTGSQRLCSYGPPPVEYPENPQYKAKSYYRGNHSYDNGPNFARVRAPDNGHNCAGSAW